MQPTPVCFITGSTTGSTTGIGAACVRDFAHHSRHVALNYLDEAKEVFARTPLIADLRRGGKDLGCNVYSVCDAGAVTRNPAHALSLAGGLGTLVHRGPAVGLG